MVHKRIQLGNSLHLTDIVQIGLVEPSEILSLKLGGESFMLFDRPVLYLVHLVELTLELDELLAAFRLSVDNALLVLFKSVNYLQKVALRGKEFKVFCIASLCIKISSQSPSSSLI
jgi:hypothetical protein